MKYRRSVFVESALSQPQHAWRNGYAAFPCVKAFVRDLHNYQALWVLGFNALHIIWSSQSGNTHLTPMIICMICTYIYIYMYTYIHTACPSTSIYLSVCLSIYLPTHPSTYLPIYLSTYLPIYLSTYLSIYLSINLSTYLPIHPSIYLCI